MCSTPRLRDFSLRFRSKFTDGFRFGPNCSSMLEASRMAEYRYLRFWTSRKKEQRRPESLFLLTLLSSGILRAQMDLSVNSLRALTLLSELVLCFLLLEFTSRETTAFRFASLPQRKDSDGRLASLYPSEMKLVLLSFRKSLLLWKMGAFYCVQRFFFFFFSTKRKQKVLRTSVTLWSSLLSFSLSWMKQKIEVFFFFFFVSWQAVGKMRHGVKVLSKCGGREEEESFLCFLCSIFSPRAVCPCDPSFQRSPPSWRRASFRRLMILSETDIWR